MKQLIAAVILLSSINVFALSGKTPLMEAGNLNVLGMTVGKKKNMVFTRRGMVVPRALLYDQVCKVEGVIIEIVKDAAGGLAPFWLVKKIYEEI